MGWGRAHAVVCAYPALGHVNPMLRLCIVLLQQGLRVTFVSTTFYCNDLKGRLSRHERHSPEGHQVLQGEGLCLQQGREYSGNEDAARKQERWHSEEGEEEAKMENTGEGCICFQGLPDGLPAEFDRTSPSTELSRAVDQLHDAFAKLMYHLQESATSTPFLLIADAFLPWTNDVAVALKIPRVIFWPQSATVFSIFGQTDNILNCGVNPFTDDLETVPVRVINFLPGLPSFPVSHLPHRVKPVKGKDRRFLLLENITKQFQHCREATCILINSHESLESFPVKDLVNKIAIPIRLVGPLVSQFCLEGQLSEHTSATDFKDAWKWLNMKAPLSVLYICLGSAVSWTKSQVEEVGLGLMAKQQAFLWVVRPWEMRQFLPHGLSKLGKAVKFAPQVQVLGHPAIGGFLSHCGWNSTLESLSAGVPLVAWPHFLDQFTNCWYVVHVWKVGVELGPVDGGYVQEGMLERGDVARAVMLLMETENGRLMRSRASDLKKIIQRDQHHWSLSRSLNAILSELIGQKK